MERKKKEQDSPTSVFKVGAIALAFLVIGYQVALFVQKVSVEHVEAMRDNPDTVFVVDSALAARLLGTEWAGGADGTVGAAGTAGTAGTAGAGGAAGAAGAGGADGAAGGKAGGTAGKYSTASTKSHSGNRGGSAGARRGGAGAGSGSAADRHESAAARHGSAGAGLGSAAARRGGAGAGSGSAAIHPGSIVIRKDAQHSPAVEQIRRSTRRVENFRFNPNTATETELQRLGFSEKQAAAIVNYREKGGRFRRKSDFAKSYVVADSVFRRLEPYIDIPKVDINLADSAAFDALPGIGGWFASKMVSYRDELGGYSFPEQLMDIYHFDREKYDGLADLIVCSPPRDTFALWSLPAEELRKHPYVRSWQAARSIVLYRENIPRSEWSALALGRAGIIPEETAAKLARCALK